MTVNYGATLSEHGRSDEADVVLRGAVDEARFTLPDSASGLGHAQYWYGVNLLAMNRPAEAERVLRSASEIYRRLDEGGVRHQRIRMELATAIAEQGRSDEAAAILRDAAVALRGTRHETAALERLRRLGEDASPERTGAAAR
jgi:hypothetical protein